MLSPSQILSSLVLPAGMVFLLAGCASRSGWEYSGEEVQQRTPSNVLTEVQLASYPPNWSIEQVMIQGIPGLVLTTASARGSTVQGSQGGYYIGSESVEYISVRGISGDPALVIVDGVPRPEGSPQIGVSTSDVARIEVLRDAASTAMYGFRGGAGVILITTKTWQRSSN
jgi:TonB-dependent SusC/RagA subfamily outer membrane receptor